MQKVSYMGNGSTTEFYFNFPYFETSNVVVTKNDTPATGCDIIGNSGGPDADIPYIGGKVVFEVAPTSLDCITIARQLPLERIVDYQPIAQINPTTLNQDLNYLMEVIKDRKDELSDLTTKYAEIADKESTEIILARITAIHEEITDIDAKIRALGDISTLRTDVTTNTGDIANLKDAANFSTTGCAAISHMAMPSDRYIDLTLGASGATYTAPADGWLNLRKIAHGEGQYLELAGRVDAISVAAFDGQGLSVWLPVAKGEIVKTWYSASGITEKFRFIYANGTI